MNTYIVCHSCKCAKVDTGANVRPCLNPTHAPRLGLVSEAQFRSELLAAGYRDNENPDLEPIVLTFTPEGAARTSPVERYQAKRFRGAATVPRPKREHTSPAPDTVATRRSYGWCGAILSSE